MTASDMWAPAFEVECQRMFLTLRALEGHSDELVSYGNRVRGKVSLRALHDWGRRHEAEWLRLPSSERIEDGKAVEATLSGLGLHEPEGWAGTS